MKKTRISIAGLAMVAALLAGVSIAWACSTQPRASMEGGRSSGPAGSYVTVNGTDFGSGLVKIRWNSNTGMELGQAMGPNFSVSVTIPQAPAGVHYIVATQTVGTASSSVAFEVTETSESPSGTSTNKTAGRTSASASGADEESTRSTAPAASTAPANGSSSSSPGEASPAGGTVQSSTAPAVTEGTASNQTSPVAPGTRGTRTSEAAAASPRVAAAPVPRATAASANPAAVVAPTGQVVFGGSQAEVVDTGEALTSVAAGTVTGDTWSGFASPVTPSLVDRALAADAAASGQASAPALGIALLGAGLVAMLAGFAVAELRRKRAFSAA